MSWQLGNIDADQDYITFGGDIESDFEGDLVVNKIMEQSLFIWIINYQGIQYGGDEIQRNQTYIYGSIDP